MKRKRVGGTRENSRMKEFPAGNIATSSSRIAFLKSLCNLPKFQEMVDLVLIMVSLYIFRTLVNILIYKFQPKASPIPDNFPSWASWKSQEIFLPASFHTSNSFNKNLLIAKKGFRDEVFQAHKIDSTLLLVDLMYREANRAMEMEPGGDDKSPDHLVNSPFGIQQMKKIENLINNVVIPA